MPIDDETKELLKKCLELEQPPLVTIDELMKKSDDFPIPIPVNTVRIRALKERGIGTDILEVRITIEDNCMWE